MSYFALLPLDLRKLLVIYLPTVDLIPLLENRNFVRALEDDNVWKERIKYHYPQDYYDNLPPSYYRIRESKNYLEKLRTQIHLLSTYIGSHTEYEAHNDGYFLIIVNSSNLKEIENYLHTKPLLSDLVRYLSSHVVRIMSNQKFFTRTIDTTDFIESVRGPGSLIGIQLNSAVITSVPSLLIYFYTDKSDTWAYEYTFNDDKLRLPYHLKYWAQSRALSDLELEDLYRLPFSLTNSDIYQ